MKTKKVRGAEAAYPVKGPQAGDFQAGLTKREYFAAMALQGIIGNINVYEVDQMTEHAVYLADSLLNALDATEESETK